MKTQHLVLEPAQMEIRVGPAGKAALDGGRGGDVLLLEDGLLDELEGLLPMGGPVLSRAIR